MAKKKKEEKLFRRLLLLLLLLVYISNRLVFDSNRQSAALISMQISFFFFFLSSKTTAVRLCTGTIRAYIIFCLPFFSRSENSWPHFRFCADFPKETERKKNSKQKMKTYGTHSLAIRQSPSSPFECRMSLDVILTMSQQRPSLTQFLLPHHHIFICTIHVDNESENLEIHSMAADIVIIQ